MMKTEDIFAVAGVTVMILVVITLLIFLIINASIGIGLKELIQDCDARFGLNNWGFIHIGNGNYGCKNYERSNITIINGVVQ